MSANTVPKPITRSNSRFLRRRSPGEEPRKRRFQTKDENFDI
jgi:hypothetical protein